MKRGERLPLLAMTREERAFLWFARHRNLTLGLPARGRFVAAFDRAKVDERVFFLGLRRESRGPTLFASQPHLDVMHRANWNLRFNDVSTENHVEEFLHRDTPLPA